MTFTSSSFCQQLNRGIWRAELRLTETEALPFLFEARYEGAKPVIHIINAGEKIKVDEIRFSEDSMVIRLPVFDSEIRARMLGSRLEGVWINHARKSNNQVPFTAVYGKSVRFETDRPPQIDVTGKWEVDFSPGSEDSTKAIGLFRQKGNTVSGTFLTATGDYRFLEGNVEGDSVYLSCFDGTHAYLFKAKLEKMGGLTGTFWAGKHWKEPWRAVKNDKYELPDAESLTYLKPGYERVSFRLPSFTGDTVSLEDQEFKNKVVIIQIMGSWCPNCMDETSFLSEYYRANKEKGLEVVGLAFEKTSDKKQAWNNIERLKKRFRVEYPVLLAGTSNKEQAASVLPMLNHIMSYPTTIFIDKKGIVRKIHTGFAGPATGAYYEAFVEKFDSFMEKLLKE
jgi:thiol-disulfide isomerase/thioredoxin